MITNSGCVVKVTEAEVVEELPRDVDFERYLTEISAQFAKATDSPDEVKRHMEYYQTQSRKHRLAQPHFFVKFEAEAAIPCNDYSAEMMFGKYKGKPLCDIPEHYFQFLIKKHLEDIGRYVTEVQRRKALERLTGERIIVGEMEW